MLFPLHNIVLLKIIAGFFLEIGYGSAHSDFGYHGDRGPSHWADDLNYGSCAGKLQSPIAIEDRFVNFIRYPPLVFKGFESRPVASTLTNNGHTVTLQVTTSELVTLSGGPLPGIYVFSQLHFHWGANDSLGSEDLINNHSFPMELHMVFFKLEYGDKDTALLYKDGLCVLAVFYEEEYLIRRKGPCLNIMFWTYQGYEYEKFHVSINMRGPYKFSDQAYQFENSVYSEIVEHLDSVTLPHTEARLHDPMTLDDLLPANKHNYYAYNGSLTTPPCSEVVTWIDFKEPIPLSSYQIAAFRRLRSTEGQMTQNFRPVQPLGDRIVYFNVGQRQDVSFTGHHSFYGVDNKSTTPEFTFEFLYILIMLTVFR